MKTNLYAMIVVYNLKIIEFIVNLLIQCDSLVLLRICFSVIPQGFFITLNVSFSRNIYQRIFKN